MNAATAETLQQLVRSGWRLLALESCEEDRALGVIDFAAEATGRSSFSWSLASGLTLRNATEEIRTDARGSLTAGLESMAAVHEPALFSILDAHRVLDDPLAVRGLRDALPQFASRRQAVVFLAPGLRLPVELVRETARLELPLPSAPDLSRLLLKVTQRGSSPVPEPEVLTASVRAAQGLTAAEAARAFHRAFQLVPTEDDDAVTRLIREKKRILGHSPALSFHDEAARLDTVGGLGALKRWLGERQRAFGEEARDFGLPTPRGLLLLGVQGCGKSLCAKAVAQEWQFPLLRLDLAAAFGSENQSPEAATREAIAVAESMAPAVLWIDEMEKGFATAEADTQARRVLGSFLTWLSEKRAPVFVVATANDVSGLPPELLRRGRFDEIFFVDLPSPGERAEILAIHLHKHGRDPLHHRVDELADQAERLTGAEIEQVVAAALYSAFAAGRELSDEDLSDAITETVPLYDTYEERIKELRDWARQRARPASIDRQIDDLFGTTVGS
ncbi:AAA family ATPase [Myxococcota bacterium]|nr:AAA family ATPase [Myxococcota bacterium]